MHERGTILVSAALSAALFLAVNHMRSPQSLAPGGQFKLDGRRSLGAAKSYKNLTLIPVYDSAARSTDTYMTLDEGLKTKVVKVKESPQGGEVNTLYITNGGRKPLYLMAGEVVLGGQQDRCLGRDIIVPPDKRDQPVTVFCVEHGRWTGRKEFADSAKAVASWEIRASAQEGAFAAQRVTIADSASNRVTGRSSSAGLQTTGSARQAAVGGRANRIARSGAESGSRSPAFAAYSARVGEEQQKVWDNVEKKNRRFKAAPATGTYREVLNQSGGEAQKSIEPYVKALLGSLVPDARLVGVVAAVNGKVVSADIFGDPSLFRKLWPKLLRSYAADAAENAPATGQKISVAAPDDAKAFLVGASDAKSKMENRSDVSTTLRMETKSSLTYKIDAAGKPGTSMGGGGFGGSVHTNVLRK